MDSNKDDVPNPTTGTQEVTEIENDQQIEAVANVPIGDGVEETQGQPSGSLQIFRYMMSHPADLIISDPNVGMRTRSSSFNTLFAFNAFISQVKPKNIKRHCLMLIVFVLCKRS